MINYELHPTETTPYVHLDANTGEFCLKGVSIPENATQFFLPIMSWLEGYAQQPQPKTTVHIQLEYFNTSSSKRIFDMLKHLEQLITLRNRVAINWYYDEDDEDIFNAGTDYKALLSKKMEFKLLPLRSQQSDKKDSE